MSNRSPKSTAGSTVPSVETDATDASTTDDRATLPPVKFTRAAGVLELARESDSAVARALRELHVALDAYGRILGISPVVSASLGFANQRLIGRRLLNRVVAADRARFQQSLAAARTAQIGSEIELRFRASDERFVDAVLTAAAVARAGTAIVIVFRVALAGGDDAGNESRAQS